MTQQSLPRIQETEHERLARQIHADLVAFSDIVQARITSGANASEEAEAERLMVAGTETYANYLRETGNYYGWAKFSSVAMRRLRYQEIWLGLARREDFTARAEQDAHTELEFYREADQLWGQREKLHWRDHWLATRSEGRSNGRGVQYSSLIMTEGVGTDSVYRPSLLPIAITVLPMYNAGRTFETVEDAKAWCERTMWTTVRNRGDHSV